ncbi:GAST1 protein homolog 1 [Actinidia rufa]|uniref:GAST1 protein homolog 1 n=1 Tax=Actinidia rufa TaxID=165716 RepID=A0A7J0GHY6_9ERIC|nr:GAST1 protein homolog 1 [Actinidia rufa]GFZ10429.1 GAST1 protein homolog 1 [Actinidia rufa]
MAILSKALFAYLFISLLIFHLVRADDEMIVGERARSGASYRRGRICAIGHAELAASAATACHLAPPATKMSAPATPPSPPTAAERSALRTIKPSSWRWRWRWVNL